MNKVRRVSTRWPKERRGKAEAYEALTASDEPCALIRLYAHESKVGEDGFPLQNVNDELEEAVLVPASWFEGVEEAIDEETDWKNTQQGVIADLVRRVAALESERPARPEAEDKALGLVGTGVAESVFGMIEGPWEAAGLPPQVFDKRIWQVGQTILRYDEIEGLDKQGFRSLLREKLNAVYLELMREWEARNGG